MVWVEKKEFVTEISADLSLFLDATRYASFENILTKQHDESYQKTDEITIPLSAFSCGASTLRIVVKYLKDMRRLEYATIARMLKRDYQTIITTYKAFPEDLCLPTASAAILVPVSIFSQRDIPPLEAIVSYLKSLGLSFAEIATLLRRDQRTVWTAHHRKITREVRP